MYERTTRPLTEAERAELTEALAEARDAPVAYLRAIAVRAAVVAAALLAFWLWIRSIDRTEAFVLTTSSGLFAAGFAAVGFARHVRAARLRAVPARTALAAGKVVEDRIEADRVAIAGHETWAAPGVGAMESAGIFYDIGDGRFYYWLATWSHAAEEPEFPRQSLRVTWLVPGRSVFGCASSGDLLPAGRVLPPDVLPFFSPGTLVNGPFESLGLDALRQLTIRRNRS